MKTTTMAAGLLLAGLAAAPAAMAAPDAQELLRQSDQARGGDLPGLAWEVRLANSGSASEDLQPMRLDVRANKTASLAEVREPLSNKGSKMLQVDRNMWLSKPGLKKPVAISPRLRLSGQAAIGDIAATNYAKDYAAKLLREETLNGEPCYVLDLKSANKQSTYDRIVYWVSEKRMVGVQAQFYSLSGKLLKQASFQYDNTVKVGGKSIPFVSAMQINDALTDARTMLKYGELRVKTFADAEFQVDNL
ncbi:outer membrane lipoprotein-sorting protein [Chromobacterium vaccinii]|uniref:outer membrane lipoprotein-sorting protein n=1 Tax=Chromobacterium vaccinii TaxID=1108595 RepID=UPI001E5BDD9E|nr:outer membrane lipoprotein-sorting protein [Chromobacterium vaccinii]MCD4485273.1 outer membrane lipoprotein-sorting protein [Chromobacterium vaccinii]